MMRLLAVSALMVAVAAACGGGKSSQKADEKPTTAQAAPADAGPAEPAPQACDLWQQNCPDGQGCMMASGQSVCVPAGANAEAAACEKSNDCQKGLVCTPDGCRKLCDATHACAGGATCTMFDNMPNLGACTAPPPAPAPAPEPAPAPAPAKKEEPKKKKK